VKGIDETCHLAMNVTRNVVRQDLARSTVVMRGYNSVEGKDNTE
tara:strand:+ start:1775 stop:1906 length:132 start_codon:yes stop_codon:yes gene_type:complete